MCLNFFCLLSSLILKKWNQTRGLKRKIWLWWLWWLFYTWRCSCQRCSEVNTWASPKQSWFLPLHCDETFEKGVKRASVAWCVWMRWIILILVRKYFGKSQTLGNLKTTNWGLSCLSSVFCEIIICKIILTLTSDKTSTVGLFQERNSQSKSGTLRTKQLRPNTLRLRLYAFGFEHVGRHVGRHVGHHVGHHVSHLVGHHFSHRNVVTTLCDVSGTLAEWKSESMIYGLADGQTDWPR